MNSGPVPPQTDSRPAVTPRRSLVLHADDFGMSPAVNRGIVAAFSQGILTSTSLLANAPAVDEAVQGWNELELRRRHRVLPGDSLRRELRDPALPFDLGVHLNLTQGRPLTAGYPAELLDHDGRFPGIGRLFASTLRKLPAGTADLVRRELETQVESLLDAGAPLRHLNGHQYVECLPLVSDLVPGLAHQYGLESVRVACEHNLGRVLAEGRWAAWGLALVKRQFARRWRAKARAAQLTFADSFVGTAHAGLWETSSLGWCVEQARGDRIEVGLHPGVEAEPGWRVVGDWPTAEALPERETAFAGSIPLRSAGQRSTQRFRASLETGADVPGGPAIPARTQSALGASAGGAGRTDQAADGWDDPLATGRPRELAVLTSAAFAARLAAAGCVLGRLAEWRQAGALPSWRKAG